MGFERARTNANKQIRYEQIKAAAIVLFDTMPYHEITLASIAKELNFTRGNLYKYIRTKEEIYLLLFIDEINTWNQTLESRIMSDYPQTPANFSRSWADATVAHPRFLRLYSILYTVIERNTTEEKLITFKKDFLEANDRTLNLVKQSFPELDEDTLKRLTIHFMASGLGLYPLINPSENQKKAILACGREMTYPDFADCYAEALTHLLEGTLRSRKQ